MKMAQTHNHYTREFKLETLELARTSGKSIAQLERDLGLSQGLLHYWKRHFKADGEQAFPGNGKLKADDEAMRQLKRENEILRQERDILKKALAILSQEPK
jgi:transposase